MADRATKVTLSAQVAQYNQAMQDAAKHTREVGSEAEKLAQKREAFDQLGRGMLVTGAAFTAGAVLSVKAAMDWESAWAGVTKTVEGTPEELSAVEQGLRDLTSVLPASHEEIAAVAEAAGQLGVQTPNVVAFTRTMIDLGETTNLSANDAATALARFSNIMGTSQGDADRLGSAIVGLGNNYATTEAEIVEMSLRLAGAGKQIGLTEGDVLGLSTALSSVGIEAEAGGSAFSKVMIDIAASVDEGGERLEMFAGVAGVSAEEFAAKWRSEPSEALALFVQGLSDAESQGSSTLGVLAELGITEVRMRDALLRSASASDQFTAAMAQGNKEFEDNNALTAEAAKRYDTVESKMAIAGNAIRDAAIDVGEQLLPAVAAGAESITGLAQLFGDLPEPVQGLIGIFGSVAGVVGLVGGAALLAVPKIAAFKVAMADLNWNMGRMALIGGGAVVAMSALAAVVGHVMTVQAQARQRAESYAQALQQGSEAAEELALQNLAVEKTLFGMNFGSAYDNAEKLGIGLDLVAEAAQGDVKALEELNGILDVATGGGDAAQKMADDLGISMIDLAQSAGTLREAVKEETDGLARGTEIRQQSKDATDENTDSTLSAAEAYTEAADEASELEGQLSELIDRINEANGVGQDAVSANANYQAALAGISEEVQRQKDAYEEAHGSLDGFVLSLDESTESGSANAAMLADVAGKAQDAALKQFELDKTTMSAKDATDKYAGTLAAQRQAFIDSAIGAGYNADEVQILADKVFALPSEKEIQILADAAAAQGVIDRFIYLNNGRRVNLIVDGVPGRQVHGSDVSAVANGGVFAYSDGGFATGIYSGGTPIHKFAEPETGWEAYISGKPDQRNRNIGLWMETGRRLGVDPALAPAVSLDGAHITGTLDLGDGLYGFVEAVVHQNNAEQARIDNAGRRRVP